MTKYHLSLVTQNFYTLPPHTVSLSRVHAVPRVCVCVRARPRCLFVCMYVRVCARGRWTGHGGDGCARVGTMDKGGCGFYSTGG